MPVLEEIEGPFRPSKEEVTPIAKIVVVAGKDKVLIQFDEILQRF